METAVSATPLQQLNSLSQMHIVRQLVLMGGIAASIIRGWLPRMPRG